MKKEDVKIWINEDIVYDMDSDNMGPWCYHSNIEDIVMINWFSWNISKNNYIIDKKFLKDYEYTKREVRRILEMFAFYVNANKDRYELEEYYSENWYKDYITKIEDTIHTIENLL